jgi:hypothetical protein
MEHVYRMQTYLPTRQTAESGVTSVIATRFATLANVDAQQITLSVVPTANQIQVSCLIQQTAAHGRTSVLKDKCATEARVDVPEDPR